MHLALHDSGSRASRQLVDALLGSREHQGWAQQLDGAGADQGSLLSLGRWSKGMKDARHGDGGGGGSGGRDHDRACGRGRGVDVGPAVERGQWSGALEMKLCGEAETKSFLEGECCFRRDTRVLLDDEEEKPCSGKRAPLFLVFYYFFIYFLLFFYFFCVIYIFKANPCFGVRK